MSFEHWYTDIKWHVQRILHFLLLMNRLSSTALHLPVKVGKLLPLLWIMRNCYLLPFPCIICCIQATTAAWENLPLLWLSVIRLLHYIWKSLDIKNDTCTSEFLLRTLPHSDMRLFSQRRGSGWTEYAESWNGLLLHDPERFLCWGICAPHPRDNTSKCKHVYSKLRA